MLSRDEVVYNVFNIYAMMFSLRVIFRILGTWAVNSDSEYVEIYGHYKFWVSNMKP